MLHEKFKTPCDQYGNQRVHYGDNLNFEKIKPKAWKTFMSCITDDIVAEQPEKFRDRIIDECLFEFFWYGIEAAAGGGVHPVDCPFTGKKLRYTFLAGMEWFESYTFGIDCIGKDRVFSISVSKCELLSRV